MGSTWPDATAVDAKVWRRSWIRTSLTRARTRCQKGCRSLNAEWLAGQGAGDDPRIAVDALATVQVFDCGCADMHDFFAGLGIGQAQCALVEIDVVPLQSHDFAKSTPGQYQQSRRQNGGGQLDALAFHLLQHFAYPAQLGGAKEPLALFSSGYFRMCLRGFDPSGRGPHISASTNILETTSRQRFA